MQTPACLRLGFDRTDDGGARRARDGAVSDGGTQTGAWDGLPRPGDGASVGEGGASGGPLTFVPAPKKTAIMALAWSPAEKVGYAATYSGAMLRLSGESWQLHADNVTTEILRAVWADPATGEAFAVGDKGVILRHLPGGGWVASPSQTIVALRGVWGANARDVWCAGDQGTLLHFDGASWKRAPSPTTLELRTVFGFSASQIWTVGYGGLVLRYDGSAWKSEPDAPANGLRDIWGLSTTELWVVGDGGLVLRRQGAGWVRIPSTVSQTLHALRGVSPTELWAVGDEGTVVRFDGTRWSAVALPPLPPDVIPPGQRAPNLHGVAYLGASGPWIGGQLGTLLRPSR